MTTLTTTFEFVLPRGLVDETGQVHRQGTMRLATAKDELVAQQHPQVRKHPEYLMLVMLSQVIGQIGTLSQVSPLQLERLFTQDLSYLKEFYNRLNQQGHPYVAAHCSECDRSFQVELTLAGESFATP
ncbi:phage tail assembly protein [Leptothoe spongobia]|uniref:Phage tail assembly protein n=1 Tax=Leptothoe spongobia TAU-MAC 1115 TaxID=1967444 RepID=A0A947DH42_9CYAN|nr:phage tail assembly protein [Leptothoe spongobia]MBT9316665.1 phage tail assembly protein [Leptothoe spongobia TAU-MAC 1115]